MRQGEGESNPIAEVTDSVEPKDNPGAFNQAVFIESNKQ